MYLFIYFKRKRWRDRDGGVKKEEEREIKDGERNFSLFILVYLIYFLNKVFVLMVMYFFFLIF